MQHSAKSGHRPQRKTIKVEKLLLGGSCNEIMGGAEAGEEAGFHCGAVNVPSTIGADHSLLLPSSRAPIGITAYPHALQTGRQEENQRISKRTVDTFYKANIVTFLGIEC